LPIITLAANETPIRKEEKVKTICLECGKLSETVPVKGQKVIYYACSECLKDILPVELCRIIGHDFRYSHHETVPGIALPSVTRGTLRCERCGKFAYQPVIRSISSDN
jgi:hypothetical protein